MHYKHEWFEKTLVNASAVKTLAEAAPQWDFSHFGVVSIATGEKYDNCQICHARISQFTAIRNKKNAVYLFIGGDCYDKLLHYLATEKIEAVTLGERRQYVSAIKKYCKKNINAAFLEWFKGRELFEEIKRTLLVIESLGYAPSLKAAEDLVEYYKNHRLFPLEELIGVEEGGENEEESDLIKSLPHRLPEEITIAQLPKVQRILARWKAMRKTWPEKLGRTWIKKIKELIRRREQVALKIYYINIYGFGLRHHDAGLDVRFPLRELAKTKKRLGKLWQEICCQGALEKTKPATATILLRGKNPTIAEPDFKVWVKRAILAAETNRMETLVKDHPDIFFKAPLSRGTHQGAPQWEYWRGDSGIKYILHQDDRYDPAEGEVYLREYRALNPFIRIIRRMECPKPNTK